VEEVVREGTLERGEVEVIRRVSLEDEVVQAIAKTADAVVELSQPFGGIPMSGQMTPAKKGR
jgi:hypothetical protein